MWPLNWRISCSDHSWFSRYTITQKEFCFSWNRAVVVLISEICAHWLFSTLLARLFNQGNFWLALLVGGTGSRRWEGKRERSQTVHFLRLTPGSLLKSCLHSGPRFLSEGCWPTLALPRLPACSHPLPLQALPGNSSSPCVGRLNLPHTFLILVISD